MKALRSFETSELLTERQSITSQKTWDFNAVTIQDIPGSSRNPDSRGFPQTVPTQLRPRVGIPVAFAVIL